MMRLISLFLSPPPMPDIQIPVIARLVPHARETMRQVCEFFYYRGAFDGFILGSLVTLMLQPSIRQRLAKGASHVAEQI